MKVIVTLETTDLFPPFSRRPGDKTNWTDVRRQFNGFPSILAPGYLVNLVDRLETELEAQIILLSTCNEMQRFGMQVWASNSFLIGPVWRQVGKPGERKLVLQQDDTDLSDLAWKAKTIAELCGSDDAIVVDGDENLMGLLPENVSVVCYDSLQAAADLLETVAATKGQGRRY